MLDLFKVCLIASDSSYQQRLEQAYSINLLKRYFLVQFDSLQDCTEYAYFLSFHGIYSLLLCQICGPR